MTNHIDTARPVKVDISGWAGAGWDGLLRDFWTNVLVGLVAAVLMSALALLTGPIFAGLANYGLRKNETDRAVARTFFDGFANFIPALLASLLIFVFALFGFILLVIPGVVIIAMYMFTFHFMVDRELEFWDAMEASRKLVSRDYLGFALFALFLGAINLLGLMLFGIGVILTLPITGFALTAAYLDCTGAKPVPLQAEPIRID